LEVQVSSAQEIRPPEEKMLRAILEASPSFLHVLKGPQFVFEFANEAYHRLVGRRDLIGRPAFDVMPEAAHGGYPERIARVMKTGEPFHGHELPVWLARTPGADVEERIIELVYLPLFEPDGTCESVLGHGTDVTESVLARKRAEADQQRTNQRLEGALAAGKMATWEWNVRTGAFESSASMALVLGMAPDKVFTTVQEAQQLLHPDDREAHKALVKAGADNGGSWHSEYRMVVDGGRTVWLEERAHSQELAGGGSVMVGVLWDITARKEAEGALQISNVRKSNFLATLAHELRNPLAPIRNGLEVFRRSAPLDDGLEKTRQMMERQLTHLVRLVDDLLEVSRIDLGKLELRRERVLLSSILASAVEGTWSRIEERRIELVQDFQNPAAVDADRDRLAQVFSNLLWNAAKFSEPGGKIWLTLALQGNEAVVSVRDTGCGIPAESLETIFDMFAQGPTHMLSGGLGIGLSLVRQLVDLHGGSVHAQSDGVGKGSTFVVRLPISRVTSQAPAPMQTSQPVKRTQGMRVLVVDDETDGADTLAMVLELAEHTVQVAYDGPAALQALASFQPHVVLLDLGMPGMSGYEVARAIRRGDNGGGVHLVALTGWGQAEDKARASEAGFDIHLTKPVDIANLTQVLSELTGRH
jgi:PAS domain S-box-containing protein